MPKVLKKNRIKNQGLSSFFAAFQRAIIFQNNPQKIAITNIGMHHIGKAYISLILLL